MVKKKNCTKCKKFKSLSEFHKRSIAPDGHAWRCKTCQNAYEQKVRCTPKSKKYEKVKALRRKYNMTLDDHLLMYVLQNGCCKICKQPTAYNKICVDHDHKTNKVRGLLCTHCNTLLGMAKDNLQILVNAIEYLE